jgi:hypothetical protein
MSDTYYTRDEAMKLLGLRSTNSFHHLRRKYPEAFVNVNITKDGQKHPRYDKYVLDKFVAARNYFLQEKL